MSTSKVYQLTITGKDLKRAIEKLKTAFPRKKKEINARSVVISTSPGKVTFSIVGASVDIPGQSNDVFTAEIPFIEFKMIREDPYKSKEELLFQFSPGSLTFRGIPTKSPAIHVTGGENNPGRLPLSTPPTPSKSFLDPADSPIGMPLLGAYAYMKKYGYQPAVANKVFAHQQQEVQTILDKADKLLEPLGISRDDLEAMIDKRLGL